MQMLKEHSISHFENIIKGQITLSKHSINVSGRMLVHNLSRTF